MGTRRSVLVVEDDVEIRELISDTLEKHGYDYVLANDGRQALAVLEKMRASGLPDVIVLDLMMPVMNGYEFLAARAEVPALAAIPMVIASAAPAEQDLASSTWNELLRKPFTPAGLISAVEKAARSRPKR